MKETEFTPEEHAAAVETEEAVKEFDKEREKALEEQKIAVDKAKSEIKKHLEGKSGGHNPTDLETEFRKIQEALLKRFGERLNTVDEDAHIAKLVRGERFTERFELGRDKFFVTFRNITTEENTFAASMSLRNHREIIEDENAMPKYDRDWRFDMLLAFSIVELVEQKFTPPDLAEINSFEEDDDKSRAEKLNEFLRKLNAHINLIKRTVPYGLDQPLRAALQAWLTYQKKLVSPEKLANF